MTQRGFVLVRRDRLDSGRFTRAYRGDRHAGRPGGLPWPAELDQLGLPFSSTTRNSFWRVKSGSNPAVGAPVAPDHRTRLLRCPARRYCIPGSRIRPYLQSRAQINTDRLRSPARRHRRNASGRRGNANPRSGLHQVGPPVARPRSSCVIGIRGSSSRRPNRPVMPSDTNQPRQLRWIAAASSSEDERRRAGGDPRLLACGRAFG